MIQVHAPSYKTGQSRSEYVFAGNPVAAASIGVAAIGDYVRENGDYGLGLLVYR
jgi:hypothetical protein